LSLFFKTFPEADFERCVTKWRKISPDVLGVRSTTLEMATGGRYKAVAVVLMTMYNKGLRKFGRILEWPR